MTCDNTEIHDEKIPQDASSNNSDQLTNSDEAMQKDINADTAIPSDPGSSQEYSLEEFMLLKQQNDEYASKLQEYESIIKRQQAEFENYRKRTLKEKSEYFKYAGFEVFKDLLTTVDDFDRALQTEVKDKAHKAFLKGFEMIDEQIKNLMKKHQVTEISGTGSEFNPSLHQAISAEEDKEVKTNTVMEVFQKGYLLHDKVLREAKVKIKKPVACSEKDPKEIKEKINNDGETEG